MCLRSKFHGLLCQKREIKKAKAKRTRMQTGILPVFCNLKSRKLTLELGGERRVTTIRRTTLITHEQQTFLLIQKLHAK